MPDNPILKPGDWIRQKERQKRSIERLAKEEADKIKLRQFRKLLDGAEKVLGRISIGRSAKEFLKPDKPVEIVKSASKSDSKSVEQKYKKADSDISDEDILEIDDYDQLDGILPLYKLSAPTSKSCTVVKPSLIVEKESDKNESVVNSVKQEKATTPKSKRLALWRESFSQVAPVKKPKFDIAAPKVTKTSNINVLSVDKIEANNLEPLKAVNNNCARFDIPLVVPVRLRRVLDKRLGSPVRQVINTSLFRSPQKATISPDERIKRLFPTGSPLNANLISAEFLCDFKKQAPDRVVRIVPEERNLKVAIVKPSPKRDVQPGNIQVGSEEKVIRLVKQDSRCIINIPVSNEIYGDQKFKYDLNIFGFDKTVPPPVRFGPNYILGFDSSIPPPIIRPHDHTLRLRARKNWYRLERRALSHWSQPQQDAYLDYVKFAFDKNYKNMKAAK